jgi:predicted transposase YbfD/YdcC
MSKPEPPTHWAIEEKRAWRLGYAAAIEDVARFAETGAMEDDQDHSDYHAKQIRALLKKGE